MVTSDGTEGRFSLEVFYHELNSDWLADRLTEEYRKDAQSNLTPVDAPSPAGVDRAYFFEDDRGCPTAVLRRGNTVVSVSFMRMDLEDPNLNMDSWIARTTQKWPAS